ncbi:MAG: hypothetical protein INR69_21035 [Mucilaginibacter polytrichastri]|nr:hypothetical protein [Mucilaginibacter polytrichastri]
MKNLKKNLSLVAVLLGSSLSVFATATPKNASDILWGRQQNGTWVQTTTSARCTASTQVCKKYFPAGQNPNTNASGGTTLQDNGYIQ